MTELHGATLIAGERFRRWLRGLPCLQAVRLPRFAKDALYCFFGSFVFLCLLHAGFWGRVVAWTTFSLFGIFFVGFALLFGAWAFAFLLHLFCRKPLPEALRQEPFREMPGNLVAFLPDIIWVVWAFTTLTNQNSVWLSRAAFLIWLNYFAVGCAVALRRGVDDFLRSRKQRA